MFDVYIYEHVKYEHVKAGVEESSIAKHLVEAYTICPLCRHSNLQRFSILESGSWRDCCQSGVNAAPLFMGITWIKIGLMMMMMFNNIFYSRSHVLMI